MDEVLKWIQIIGPSITFIGVMFLIYEKFRKPDTDNEKAIELINQRCEITHQNLDNSLLLIRENHLKHLEKDVSEMKIDIGKILTILDERNKRVL